MKRHPRTSTTRLRRRGSTSEFAVVLMVFFLVLLFPMIDLVALGAGAATLFLVANESASHAGVSLNYEEALNAAANRCLSLQRSGFGKFAKMDLVGGVSGTGVHLFVVRTDYSSNQVQYCGPDSPAIPPIDTTGFVYEYMAIVRCNVGPFINLSFVPFLGDVPGLGKAAQLSFTSHSAVENPGGIASANNTNNIIDNGGADMGIPPGWDNQTDGTTVRVSPGPPKQFEHTLDLPSPW